MSNFRPIDRDTDFLMPPSVEEWLPERHLARFVVEVVVGFDLRAMTRSYRDRVKHPTIRRYCSASSFTVMLLASFRAASWNAPPMTRWRFA
jgi:hypothetical protein